MAIKEGLAAFVALSAICCRTNVKVEPVEIKPITMTININVKVDRQLDEFFDFEEKLEPEKEGNAQGGEQ